MENFKNNSVQPFDEVVNFNEDFATSTNSVDDESMFFCSGPIRSHNHRITISQHATQRTTSDPVSKSDGLSRSLSQDTFSSKCFTHNAPLTNVCKMRNDVRDGARKIQTDRASRYPPPLFAERMASCAVSVSDWRPPFRRHSLTELNHIRPDLLNQTNPRKPYWADPVKQILGTSIPKVVSDVTRLSVLSSDIHWCSQDIMRPTSSESHSADNGENLAGKDFAIFTTRSDELDLAKSVAADTVISLKTKIAELYADLESLRCAHSQAVDHEADLQEVVSSLRRSRNWYEEQLSIAQSIRAQMEAETDRLHSLLKDGADKNHRLVHENACLQAQLACSRASLADAKRNMSNQLESIRVDMIEREALFERIASERTSLELQSLQRSDELNSIQAEMTSLQTELRASNAQSMRQREHIKQLEDSLSDAEARNATLEEKLQLLSNALQEQKVQLDEHVSRFTDAVCRIKSLESSGAEKDSAISALTEENRSISSAFSATCKEKDILDAYLCTVKDKLSHIEDSFEKLRFELNAKNAQLTSLLEQRDNLAAEVQRYRVQLAELKDFMGQSKSEVNSSRISPYAAVCENIAFHFSSETQGAVFNDPQQPITDFIVQGLQVASTSQAEVQTQFPEHDLICSQFNTIDRSVGSDTPMIDCLSSEKPDIIYQHITQQDGDVTNLAHLDESSHDFNSIRQTLIRDSPPTCNNASKILPDKSSHGPPSFSYSANGFTDSGPCKNEFDVCWNGKNMPSYSQNISISAIIPNCSKTFELVQAQSPFTSGIEPVLSHSVQLWDPSNCAPVSNPVNLPSDAFDILESQGSLLDKSIHPFQSVSDYFKDSNDPFLECSLDQRPPHLETSALHQSRPVSAISANETCFETSVSLKTVEGSVDKKVSQFESACFNKQDKACGDFADYPVKVKCAEVQCDSDLRELEQEVRRLRRDLRFVNHALDTAMIDLASTRSELALQVASTEREHAAYESALEGRKDAVHEIESLREKLQVAQSDLEKLRQEKQRLQMDSCDANIHNLTLSTHSDELQALKAIIKTTTAHLAKTSESLNRALSEKMTYQSELARLKGGIRAQLERFRLFARLDITEKVRSTIVSSSEPLTEILAAIGVDVHGLEGLLGEGNDLSLLYSKPIHGLNRCFETLQTEIHNLEDQVVNHAMAVYNTFGDGTSEGEKFSV